LARTARAAARTSSASLRSFTSSRRRFAVTEYSYTRQGSLEADARWRPSAGERAETSSVGFAAMPDRTARDRIGSHLWLRCGVPLRRRAAGADQTSCSGTSFIRWPSGASSWSACGTCAAQQCCGPTRCFACAPFMPTEPMVAELLGCCAPNHEAHTWAAGRRRGGLCGTSVGLTSSRGGTSTPASTQRRPKRAAAQETTAGPRRPTG
jgi:hypothetical protein